MHVFEPTHTAFLLVVLGVLMAISVLFSRTAGRLGVPIALLFILTGVLAGSEGLGGIVFDDYALTFRIGTVALVLILFDGGLNTPLDALKQGLAPATVLASIGVVATAGLVALAGHLLGMGWNEALLTGAIVSSTDAAAVFSVLRGSGLHLKQRVGVTLEVESGLNDPMAFILTFAFTEAFLTHRVPALSLVGGALMQIALGGGVGLVIGWGGRLLLKRVPLQAGGLYPVLTTGLAFVAFAVPTLLHGSGFLAVYVAAVLLGNEAIRYRSGLLRVHDALAWLSQVVMFLVLGLLSHPLQLLKVAPLGLALGLLLAFLVRPLVVVLCLLPFKYTLRERIYVGWVGLRGAVPIILATFPVLANVPGAHDIFNVVFFIVVVNALIPGATVQWVTRRLSLLTQAPPPPPAVLEITSTQLLSGELRSFHIVPASAACGASIADLPFPPSASAMLIVRGSELLAPKGNTVLQSGDHIYVFCKPEDLQFVDLIFGHPEVD